MFYAHSHIVPSHCCGRDRPYPGWAIVCIVFALVWTHTLQEMVPGEMLGRVYSIDALGSFVLLPIGFSLAGWATDLAGAPTVFLIGSLGTMTLAVLALFHPAIRNLD